MKTFLAFATACTALLLSACGKDKFETKPFLEIKDYNTKVLSPNDALSIRLIYYDKEGDLNGGKLIIRKIRLNKFPPIQPSEFKEDVLDSDLPEFPPKDKAEIIFQTTYDRLDETQVRSDTVQYKFAVIDKAGNSSDTITSDIIVARMP